MLIATVTKIANFTLQVVTKHCRQVIKKIVPGGKPGSEATD